MGARINQDAFLQYREHYLRSWFSFRLLKTNRRNMTVWGALERWISIRLPSSRRKDELQPFTRPAGDGTYEVVIPLADRSPPVILPYSFSSEEDGKLWILSRKGRKRIAKARRSYE
jgi:hypothetical protein